jgi:hypothetical protein
LEKGPVFRISPVLGDLDENVHFWDTSVTGIWITLKQACPKVAL